MTAPRRSERELRRVNAALVEAQRALESTNNELERRVAARTADLRAQNHRLADTLVTLQRTQEQLIHADKMASLGLLVAGIAHEIKNPLNFVTNFAELSLELLDEAAPEFDIASAPELGEDLRENLARILAHGRRADDIVTSMLLLARDKPSETRISHINDLVRDHAHLSFQGFRAEERGFNATLDLDLDPSLPRSELAYGELARAVVNLVSNACHAIRARARNAEPGYTPTITVTTRQDSEAVVITVADNGVGIPQSIRRLVFDPFFTTKAPGEGTGLGLALTYDTIVNRLRGTIVLDSTVGIGTAIRVRLPLA